MKKLTEFESSVLNMLLAGKHPVLEQLLSQLPFCCVKSREFTGVGFYTNFEVNKKNISDKNLTLRFGDVIADIDGMENGAGFVLYVEKGKLSMLEGYGYDDSWPEMISNYHLNYTTGSLNRNIDELYKILGNN